MIGEPDPFSVAGAICLLIAWPLILRLDVNAPVGLRRLSRGAALIAAAAAFFGRGVLPLALSLPALAAALAGLANGVARFLSGEDRRTPEPWAEGMSAVGPVVATAAWAWSRYDARFAGFPDPLATLTTAHFLVTFGLLPAALAAWGRARPGGALWRLSLWGLVALPPLTGALFALRAAPLLPSLPEVGGAVAMAGAALGVAASLPDRRARWIALPLALGFATGAGYAASQHFQFEYLDYHQMLRWHGALNLLCCVGLALLAPRPPRPIHVPAPDRAPPVDAGDEASALFVDHRERALGPWSPAAFAAARAVMLGYRFYPCDVMRRRTEFEEAGRPARVGDRIGVGLLLPSLPGLPPFQLPAVSEIDRLVDAPEEVVFAYATTTAHYGRGRWEGRLVRVGEQLVLRVYSHIRPSRWYVWLGLPLYRYFQTRAFHRGADTLREAVRAADQRGASR